ncbi:MAG: transposase [Candidatus Bathyarchaeia archaeon]
MGAPISIHLIGEMEVGSPKLLFENLDLTPIHSILWTGLHQHGPGRPVEYDPEWDLKALMLRQIEQIPYVKDLVKRLRRDPYLRKVCGYGERAPCEAHFSQTKSRIGAEGFRVIEAWLRREALRLRRSQPLSAVGLVQAGAEVQHRLLRLSGAVGWTRRGRGCHASWRAWGPIVGLSIIILRD